jgi:methionine-rich copper-binding protein CopC
MRKYAFIAFTILTASLLPATAMAHPRLLSSSPAANASVAKPATITLGFSETLVAPLSGIELTMTGMPGMAKHGPVPISGFTTKVTGKVLTVKLARPLAAGTYVLKWHAVAADQHRIEGNFSFTVR